MKKYYYLFILHIVFGLSFTAAFADEPFGTEIGRFNNIPAYSNCSNDCVPCNSNCTISSEINGDVYIGIKWQCVEYVRRYYYEIYNLDLASLHRGHANTFYNNAATMNLDSFANGGTEPPAIGDIIVSEGAPFGHVAIVRSVTDNEVCTIQQNFSNDDDDENRCLNLTVTNGHYNVAVFSPGYPIRGWLRRPCTDTPSDKSLARIEGQDSVYWIQNSIKYYVTSPDVLTDMSGIPGWDHICDFPPGSLDSFQNGIDGDGADFIGTNSTSNGLLIKQVDNPNVYLMENGQRKWITSAQVFDELGYNWNDVIDVSEAIINLIPEGSPIYSGYGNWIKTYHGNNPWTWGRSILKTHDGKLLLVGGLLHNVGQEEGALLMKLDKTGSIDLKKRYGDSNWFEFLCALEEDDDNFIIAGRGAYYSQTGALIVKVGPSGNLIWEKGKLYPNIHQITSIKKTIHDSYFIYGWLTDGTFIAKLNSNFEIIWMRNIPQGYHQRASNPMQVTSDGGAICAIGSYNGWPYIIKFDSNGEPLWQMRYHYNSGWADARSIIQTSDGNFVISGYSHIQYGTVNHPSSFIVFKIDGNGMLYWPYAKLFDNESSEWPAGIIESNNGDLIVAGPDFTYDATNGRTLIVRMDSTGESIWKKAYGYENPSGNSELFDLNQIDNYFFVLATHRPDVVEDSYRYDSLIMKLNSSGIVGESCDFINNATISEESINLTAETVNENIAEIEPYQYIETEIETFETEIETLPICQGSSLHDLTISQLPFGLVPDLAISDTTILSGILRYSKLYLGIRALHKLILNWPGSELKLEVFKPDGTLYGEYQGTTPPISVDIPNPEEGLWTYAVTALDIPYDEYPFSLVAGVTKFQGDFNSDGDVDGDDLAGLIESGGLSTEVFAENFGSAIP